MNRNNKGLAEETRRAEAFAKGQASLGRKLVAVQGLGFVGAAVAAVCANALGQNGSPRFGVLGLDLDTPPGRRRIAALNRGESPLASPDPNLDEFLYRAVHEYRNLFCTCSEEALSLADVIVVDVPLDAERHEDGSIQVDMAGFEAAIQAVGRHMKPDALVVIETTVPMGTTRQVAAPALEKARRERGIKIPLLLGHAYERVMPGPNYIDSIRRFWRTYSGINRESTRLTRQFLEAITDTENHPPCELAEPESSELAKLMENSYRAANIAWIHEWTLLAEKMRVNLFAVIDAIRVRKGTHDNIRLPGFGVGGYCLTKDSFLAQWAGEHFFGRPEALPMTMKALAVNRDMPLHTRDLLLEMAGEGIKGKKIAVLGASYLPDLADTRNSPTSTLWQALNEAGAKVVVHDPLVDDWPECPQAELTNNLGQALEEAYAVILAVPHRAYLELSPEGLAGFTGGPCLVVDAQNLISDDDAKELHDLGFRLMGVGKGHWRRMKYQERK